MYEILFISLPKINNTMLNFLSFGSGSSGNCYYLYTSTDGLIIDVGVGIRTLKKYFRDYGLSLSMVKNVLVTHDHADHVKCVGSLSKDRDLPVYSTKEVHDGINKNYCVHRKIPAEYQILVEKGHRYQLGDFLVTPFGVPHDSVDNVGYHIEVEGVHFVIMTDIGEVTDEMKEMIAIADYLVIEANYDKEMLQNGHYPEYLKKRIMSGTGHLCNHDCGVALAENMSEQLKRVWLCHLSEQNNHPELARKTVEAVLRSYGVVVGKDIELEVLKRTIPTGIFELATMQVQDNQ